ncbi:MAG: hypothetical protein LBK04_01045, partial [Clostridiales Family XIII bacterium]|nr:hypothetical protein [Clostridiales Family XIII bacterium]
MKMLSKDMKNYDCEEMTVSEKEIAKSIALQKINADLSAAAEPSVRETGRNPGNGRRSAHGFGRRGFAIVAAAASLVLVFTVVAFATGLLDLGTIRSADGGFEAAAIADSPQFLAMQEYQDYVDEAAANGNAGWSSQSKTSDGTWLEENAYDEKISELCDKYGLRKETVMYTPETLGETLAGAGVENFFGTFGELSAGTKNKYAGGFATPEESGYFEYWGLGSFSIGMPLDDGSTGSHHAWWHIKGVKADVFMPTLEGWSAAFYGSEPGAEEWESTTKDGYTVKCSLIEQPTGSSGRNEVYSFVLTVGGYMLNFQMRQPVPEGEAGT